MLLHEREGRQTKFDLVIHNVLSLCKVLPLYPQDTVEACVSVVSFSRVGQAVGRSRDSTHAVPHARIPVTSPQSSPAELTYRRAIRTCVPHRDNAGWNCMRHTVAKFSKEVSKEKCTCCTYHVRGPRLYPSTGQVHDTMWEAFGLSPPGESNRYSDALHSLG